MPRPRFSEMLVNRRRQLGLSISQASQVLRLKEQVLIAFEEGDFDHIPKSGYAQGMLSSYARYLGLNPRQVVSQFSSDLAEYNKTGGTSTSSSYQGDNTYLAPRKLLPTSGGPAGDLGAFATTSQPHSRQQSSPLVTRRYVGTLHDETEREYGYDSEEQYYQQQDQRPYTARQPLSSQRVSSASSARARSRRSSERGARAYSSAYGRDDVTTRKVGSGEYTDDLRYDDEASPYDAASTRSGRRSSRNIANTRRPNVQRRQSNSRAQREATARQNGVVGVIADFFSDSRRSLAAILVVLALALTAIIIFSVRSCVSGQTQEEGKTVPVTQTDSTDTTTTTGTTATNANANANANATGTTTSTDNPVDKVIDETQSAARSSATNTTQTTTPTDQNATNAEANGQTSNKEQKQGTQSATTQQNTAKQTKVVVSVEAGSVSWVEVLCDGESKVATTITGPWSETYDVHDSINVEVSDTSAVTVTENGEQRTFDSKTSGIGSLTIQGTPVPKTQTKPTSGTKADEDSEDTENEDGEKPKTERDTGNDEFLYTYDGYDVYYNEKEDLYYTFDEAGNKINAVDGTPL